VPVPGEGRDRDVGDVVGVDERLGQVLVGEGDLADPHRLQEEALVEV
jgi:hypothetical protein